MNLLPGLRELRAPLASGYLWLASLWLVLSREGWIPAKRPPGNGEVARLWDLGGTLGKTIALAALTFIAYLIGSFLEMDPDGATASAIVNLKWLNFPNPEYVVLTDAEHPNDMAIASHVSRSLSREARNDILDLLQQKGRIGERTQYDEHNDEEWFDFIEENGKWQIAADRIIYKVITEMRQLASRLLTKNKDLYGRYDRFVAEAAVRINVSIPLTLLLTLAIWLSGLPTWLQSLLTIAVLVLGIMLLRQGFRRMVSARDVIAQALVIEEIYSRYIDNQGSATDGPSDEPTKSKRSKA